ncbi:MAG: hypothetical protein ACE5H3_08870, partial [Planctomycetota bacterium]
MKARRTSESIHRALGALEGRLLTVFLVHGAGRILAGLGGMLLGLYLLDRLFAPPPAVRVVLGLAALGLFLFQVRLHLWTPLRRRPSPRDLAALWERTHPGLGDRLATVVEMPQAPPGTSAALLARVFEGTGQAMEALDPRTAVPSGRARRSALAGLGVLALLLGLSALAPTEAGIFFQRLFGGNAHWPRDTTLVLLPPFAEGQNEGTDPERTGPEKYRLSIARGTVLTLRIRAQGVVPEKVTARGNRISRLMRPLGGGEFVLRLPPLQKETTWAFSGGDDEDGLPRLDLIPGVAPSVVDWSVGVFPPAYTGRPEDHSTASEFRVPQGTRLTVRFRADRPVARAATADLEGSLRNLQAGAAGFYSFSVEAEASGERLILLEGRDGFRDARAGLLRWSALPDRPPRLRFELPDQRWITVPGGAVAVLLSAQDDYGLQQATLGEEGRDDPQAIPFDSGYRSLLHFQVLHPAAENGASALEPGASRRLRLQARALDGAEPQPHATEALSPWIEIVPREVFEERLADRMSRAREVVERIQTHTRDLLDGDLQEPPRSTARRILRDLEGLQVDLERALLERLYAGLDHETSPSLEVLDRVLAEGVPEPGGIVKALDEGGAPPPLDRSGLLLDLGKLVTSTRLGPAEELM